MRASLRPALVLFALFTLLTGVIYPAAVTLAAQAWFPSQANGSTLQRGGIVVGSTLIGQPFTDARYFWGRPSATVPTPYNGMASAGSNLGPSNPALLVAVRERVERLQRVSAERPAMPVPVDLVTASASGLDPHISVAAALYQVGRVAGARRLSEERVSLLVKTHIQRRTWGILGEPCVNVLLLNLALDDLSESGP